MKKSLIHKKCNIARSTRCKIHIKFRFHVSFSIFHSWYTFFFNNCDLIAYIVHLMNLCAFPQVECIFKSVTHKPALTTTKRKEKSAIWANRKTRDHSENEWKMKNIITSALASEAISMILMNFTDVLPTSSCSEWHQNKLITMMLVILDDFYFFIRL